MGGSAYLVHGRFEERVLAPQPAPRSLLDRLPGRSRTTGPRRMEMGNSTLVDLPSRELQPLARAFTEFVHGEIRQPWPATQTVLDYLDLDVCTVYARGTQTKAGDSEWYVQITFSGCSGMAEVSAEVCAHWAALWYQGRREEIDSRWLRPFGFHPGPQQPPHSSAIFAPLQTTYASVEAGVEVDSALLENVDDADQHLQQLGERLAPLIAEGRCRCQFCAPDLDPSAFPAL